MLMEPQDAARIWETALGELQLQVTRPYYETYLKDTVGLECREDRFIVGVPTAFGVSGFVRECSPVSRRSFDGYSNGLVP